MASKTVVELFDDLDGGRADETVRFALDGVEYEIDLSSAHAAALRDTLAVYIGHAHRPMTRKARRAAAAAAAAEEKTGHARNGRNGRNGTVGDSMTAEIRRLASESAQKVNQARAAAAAAEATDDEDFDELAETPRPPATATGPATAGPVPALVVPFLEAR